jgi:hypothetical protein
MVFALQNDISMTMLRPLTTSISEDIMSAVPKLYARIVNNVVEVATDRLTYRTASGQLSSVDEVVRAEFPKARAIRILTIEEASWVVESAVLPRAA